MFLEIVFSIIVTVEVALLIGALAVGFIVFSDGSAKEKEDFKQVCKAFFTWN